MSSYPGDLIIRAGRRVCRVGEWVEPTLIRASEPNPSSLWVCGEVIKVEGDTVTVETIDKLWAYPLDKLEVNHSQEKMTNEQYLWALLTIQERVRDGLRLSAYDSTFPGDKHTYCSWGFHKDRHAPKDIPGMWPIGMPKRQDHQPCPLATLPQPKRGWVGCFYRCLAFQRRGELTRELAISLYDDAIEKARQYLT